MRLLLNAQEIRTGRGDPVMGHPLNALTWLANTVCQHGFYLPRRPHLHRDHQEVYLAQAGDNLVADLGPIGQVEIRFAPVASAVMV